MYKGWVYGGYAGVHQAGVDQIVACVDGLDSLMQLLVLYSVVEVADLMAEGHGMQALSDLVHPELV